MILSNDTRAEESQVPALLSRGVGAWNGVGRGVTESRRNLGPREIRGTVRKAFLASKSACCTKSRIHGPRHIPARIAAGDWGSTAQCLRAVGHRACTQGSLGYAEDKDPNRPRANFSVCSIFRGDKCHDSSCHVAESSRSLTGCHLTEWDALRAGSRRRRTQAIGLCYLKQHPSPLFRGHGAASVFSSVQSLVVSWHGSGAAFASCPAAAEN